MYKSAQIRGMFKNNVDFHCSVNMFWYITMHFIWQQFTIFCLLNEKISCILHEFMQSYPLLKIPTTIADPARISDVMYVLRFLQGTKPIISSRIIRFQVEQTNNIVALAVFVFILNSLVEKTKFQYNGGSISNRNLTVTLSIDIYDIGQCKVIHPSSDLHVFWHPRNSKKYIYTDSHL